MVASNRDIRDDIKEYWSDRAATFDQDPGHRIQDGPEMRAWRGQFTRHLGPAEGRRLLDLASGTGEIARLCCDLGFNVTGLDWAEPMLALARTKLPDVTFIQADAERTMLPTASFDVIVTRHLIWTLVDPAAAFTEWHRLLVPGGQLVVVDGDFVSRNWWTRWLSPAKAPNPSTTRHQSILRRVHFSDGARSDAVADLIRDAGFEKIEIDTNLSAIHLAQARQLGWRNALLRQSEHRYAIAARKP